MRRPFGEDLTVGSVPRSLAHLAIPVFLGNILSFGYSVVNAVWVGHLLGGQAVAAVGLTFPVVLLMVAVCGGFTVASAVLVGQHFGAGYLRIVGVGYLFLIPPYVSNGVIVGAGRTAVTMALSFVSLCVVRAPLATWLSHTRLGLTGVWFATAASFSVDATLGYLYYRSGRWRRAVGAGERGPARSAA